MLDVSDEGVLDVCGEGLVDAMEISLSQNSCSGA